MLIYTTTNTFILSTSQKYLAFSSTGEGKGAMERKSDREREKYNNNNGRNGSCLTGLVTSLEEKRRWLIINASPRGLF